MSDRSPVSTVVYGPYHRLESPSQSTQVAAQQQQSSQIWGRAARWSDMLSVKAYRGALPGGARGVEFTTTVAPHSATHPTLVQWYQSDPGVQSGPDGYVWIAVRITRNTQVES